MGVVAPSGPPAGLKGARGGKDDGGSPSGTADGAGPWEGTPAWKGMVPVIASCSNGAGPSEDREGANGRAVSGDAGPPDGGDGPTAGPTPAAGSADGGEGSTPGPWPAGGPAESSDGPKASP